MFGSAGEARAGYKPPPQRLERPAWFRQCAGVLQARFRESNPYRLPYPAYEWMLWQVYDVIYHPERYPGLPGSRCAPEGSGYKNPSGYAQICKNGRWTVSDS